MLKGEESDFLRSGGQTGRKKSMTSNTSYETLSTKTCPVGGIYNSFNDTVFLGRTEGFLFKLCIEEQNGLGLDKEQFTTGQLLSL